VSGEGSTLFCPQCKQHWPKTNFECLPLDLRCNRCIPADTAMQLYDKRVQQAGQKLAQILDASESNKGLRPVERMLSRGYEAWGGEAAFMEDGINWIKSLADNPRTRSLAVAAWGKILALHAKVDRMKLEDDWRQMDDETLRETLKMKILELGSEAIEDQAKDKTKKFLLGEQPPNLD
jgi:hypothetical protein